jgi:transposase
MMSGDDVLMMPRAHRVEAFTGTGRRRRWSAEEKARIIAEGHELGVGEMASRYSLSKTQLFTWRRNAQRKSEETGFARVVVGDAAPAGGIIEVRMQAGELRVPPGADPQMVTAILLALRSDR